MRKEVEELKPVPEKSPVRRVVIEQFEDASHFVTFDGVDCRHSLLPMLRAAERHYKVQVAKHAI